MSVIRPALSGILEEAQTALDKHQPRKYRVKAEDVEVAADGWVHIGVKADGDHRDRDFYDAIAEAEMELLEATPDRQVLLVPV